MCSTAKEARKQEENDKISSLISWCVGPFYDFSIENSKRAVKATNFSRMV